MKKTILGILSSPVHRIGLAVIVGLSFYSPYGNDMSDWVGWIVLAILSFIGIGIVPWVLAKRNEKRKK